MRIQHNIPALNSHRNLGINNAATAKNLEKLSSGYRINRAGDDAAGLAISEKMRGQIRGLAMAEQNTSMGINLIQTAEGGLNETHAILQRMRELAVQSSNGTFQDSDRAQLTHEYDALMSEIDRISTSTHYNGIKLLDGSLGAGGAQVKFTSQKANGEITGATATTAQAAIFSAEGFDETALENGDVISFDVVDKDGVSKTIDVTLSGLAGGGSSTAGELAAALQASDLKDYFTITVTAGKIELTAKTLGANKETYVGAKITPAAVATPSTTLSRSVTQAGVDVGQMLDISTAVKFEIDGKKFQFVNEGGKADAGYEAIYIAGTAPATTDMPSIIAQLTDKGYNVAGNALVPTNTQLTIFPTKGKDLVFQIGANGGADQRVSLSVDDMSSKAIGLLNDAGELTHSLASSSIDKIENANAAIDIIDAATDMVSAQRAKLGALQNRLEHTLNNLGVTKENLTASESTIRDVDMAKEMMEFTKNNILVQAAQAMLAQANQLPQGVLQLLR